MAGMATRDQTIGSELDFEQYRRELTGYCYRMLGSGYDAEDAVQETMVRAWRNIEKLESPGALRSWLYRIAGNVCFDMLEGSKKRARPMDLNSPSMADTTIDSGLPEETWIQPMPDAKVVPAAGGPAAGLEGEGAPRPGVGPGGEGDAPPGVRGGAPASAAQAARGSDPARGAALAGHRGGGAARH